LFCSQEPSQWGNVSTGRWRSFSWTETRLVLHSDGHYADVEAHDGSVCGGSTSGDGGVLYHAVGADTATTGAVAAHAGVGAGEARIRILRVDVGIERANEAVFARGDVAGHIEVREDVSCGTRAISARRGGCFRGQQGLSR
jgi:hypothetical protein